MTWIMDHSSYTVACMSDAEGFDDCIEVQGTPLVTAKATLQTPNAKRSYTRTDGDCTKTCEHKWNCMKDLDPDCYLDIKAEAAQHIHSSFTITMMAGQKTVTVACRDDAEDFDHCHTLTDAPSTTMKPFLPDLAKRSFTTSHDGCTAVCKNELLEDCQVHCSPEQARLAARQGRDWTTTETVSGIARPLSCTVHDGDDTQSYCVDLDYATYSKPGPGPPFHHPLQRRDTVTVTNGGCTAVCWGNVEPKPNCDIQCSGGFAAQVALPTPEPMSKPMLQQRGLTTTHDGCTAVCWNQSPGTGCDILCHDTSITKMPEPTSDVSSLWKTTFTSFGCTFTCQDLYPGSECGVQCPGPLPTGAFGTSSSPHNASLSCLSQSKSVTIC